MRYLVFGVGGSLTALATPFRDTLVDWEAASNLAERQIDRGAAALIVCGSTGEAAALTLPEYSRLVHVVVEAASGRVPVIAGCTASSTATAVELGREAASAGADALLCAAPPYVKPTQDGVVAHIRAVAHATDIPIVLYDVPSRSGAAINDDTVARLHDAELIIGLKDATADLSRPTRLRARCGDAFMQWSGDDATAPAYRAMGGIGCISVTANVVPALCALMHRAWDNARSAAWRAVQGEQPDPGQGGACRTRAVQRRDAAAADPCQSGDAGTAAGGDAAGGAGGGARGAPASLRASELTRTDANAARTETRSGTLRKGETSC